MNGQPALHPEQFRPGSRLHEQLLRYVRERFDLAERHITQRDDAWNRAEAFARGYVDTALKDRDAKKEYPWGRAIVVPYTYAVLQTLLTSLLAVFTARRPYFLIEGRGPEDVKPAKGMELLVDYQFEQNPVVPGLAFLYQWLLDGLKYGTGIAKVIWETQEAPPAGPLAALASAVGLRLPRQIVAEHNVLVNVDPFTFYPDPRVSLGRLNDGEFVGYEVWRPWHHLAERDARQGGPYAHLDRVKETGPLPTGPARSRRAEMLGLSEVTPTATGSPQALGLYKIRELEARLIPAEFEGLGDGTRPTLWVLTVVNDQIVVRAHPNRYGHQQFTAVIMEPFFDLHSRLNAGAPEMMEGLQRVMNWLFNSHIVSVVKTLNNRLIYDPSMIDEAWLKENELSGLVPITEQFYGVPGAVERAARQLQVFDVTKSHLQDLTGVVELIHVTMGTNAPIMGVPVETRRTLGEVQAILSSASLRMQTISRIVSAQALRPMVQLMASNLLQFLSTETYVKIVGERQAQEFGDVKQGRVRVSPEEIQGHFDYPITDGTLPVDPSRLADVWKELFLATSTSPHLQQAGFDPVAFFRELAVLLGVKTIDRFRLRVVPDQQVAQGINAGTLAPLAAAPVPLPGLEAARMDGGGAGR